MTQGGAQGAPPELVIDGACPLARDPAELRRYREGGVTVCMPTVGGRDGARETLATLARIHHALRTRDDLLLVRGPADVRAAQRSGRLGLLFHLQGGDPFERDVGLVEGFRALGVRMVQLCYNVRNRIGDGCEEPADGGLSSFGIAVVRALNEAGMIVDCAHTGERTTHDAIERSRTPVVCSHGNPRAVHPSARNLTDELIRAIAGNGGLIGAVGFPGFVSASPRPSIDQFIDHIAYLADFVGVQHVAGLYGADFARNRLPDYTIVNARLAARINGRFGVHVEGENLLDEEYQVMAGYPMPGRGVSVGVHARSR